MAKVHDAKRLSLMEVARGLVVEATEEGRYRGYAVPLSQHTHAVRMLVEKLFNPRDVDAAVVKVAAELHDKYKPARMRVEKSGERFEVGFRGHPYLLSFADFEEVFGDGDREAKREVAIATGVARLHHFLNIRDVDTFIHTLALVKAYLAQGGADMPLREIRLQVLEGVTLIHVADMVAGYIEQLLLARASGLAEEAGVVDTDNLEHVEPHIPVSMHATLNEDSLDVEVFVHGLAQVVCPELSTGSVKLELHYDVYEGAFDNTRREFSGLLGQSYTVKVACSHKHSVVRGVVARATR